MTGSPTEGWGLVRARARLADTGVAMSATLLALLCLVPLFADLRWLMPAAVVVAVVCALGAGSRAIALPLPLVPIVELLGIVLTVTALEAAQQAWAKVVPTSQSWDVLRALVARGMSDAQTFTTPVPSVPELILLAVGGAGLAALSIDTLFVSVRSPLLAGIPIGVLFIGATVLQFGQAPWWGFLPAAVAWLLILAADQRERLREWGHLPGTTRIRGLSGLARRVGAVAVISALAAGILLPVRAATSPPGSGDGAGGGASADAPVVLDPLVTMRRGLTQQTDSEVLRYRTDSPNPTYLRVTALESFDGQAWRQRPGLESGRDPGWQLPGVITAPGDSATSTYDVTVTNLANAYLPLPYPLAEVENVAGVESGWRLDPATGIAFSTDVAATGTHYRLTAINPVINATELRSAPLPKGTLWPQLNYPGGMNPVVKQTALDVTAQAATPYDKAVALQNYFAREGGFRYSTSVRSGASADYIAEFLRDKVGYCEQFAGAMAIMARILGIPSRVVVGFTQGTKAEDGSWVVTVRDAHAWPELWFDGYGWVRFEPTPRADATVRTPDYAPVTGVPTGRNADDSRGRLDSEGFDPVVIDRGTDVRGIANRLALAILLVVGLGLLVLPMTRRMVRRRRRLHARDYASVVEGAWAEIGASAVDFGQPWSAFATPRQSAERLTRGMGEPTASAVRRLRTQVEQVRYGRPAGAGPAARSAMAERSAAVRADVRTVVRELRGRVRLRTRLQSVYWPPSERRRQRSSMRSMKPGDLRERGADSVVAAGSSAGRVRKAE